MWQALIKLVEKWACGHDWGEFGGIIKSYDRLLIYSDMPIKLEQTIICKKCGKIKRIEL